MCSTTASNLTAIIAMPFIIKKRIMCELYYEGQSVNSIHIGPGLSNGVFD